MILFKWKTVALLNSCQFIEKFHYTLHIVTHIRRCTSPYHLSHQWTAAFILRTTSIIDFNLS